MSSQSGLSTWLLASRPKTLAAAVGPVLMGTAMAAGAGGFHLPSALAALVGALLIQIGTNFANDYFDFKKGADTEDRVGPTRATQAGLVSPETMKRAFVLTFAAAFAVGVYLIVRGGWPLVIIGLSSILFGILYTGGPKPLGYLGLGDLLVLIYFGPVAVAGTAYVQSLHFDISTAIAGFAPGLLACAILAVNNLRDVDTDRVANKRTLAVRFGPRFARFEYVSCVVGAALVPVALWLFFAAPITVLAACGFLVLAVAPLQKLLTTSGSELNPLLGATGRLLAVFSLLFSLGWLL